MATDLTVTFDNGGGVTLQCAEYAHMYADPGAAAEDYRALADGASPIRWDGNDVDARFMPTDEQLRNGGYKVLAPEDVRAIVDAGEIDSSWHNERAFFRALGCTTAE